MGTSTSRRSPSNDIRWRAARTALGYATADRAAEQLLAAASSDAWPAMLRSEALQALAASADEAIQQVVPLAQQASPNDAVRRLVEQARDRAIAAGDGGLLVALGERSLSRLLLLQLRGDDQAGPGGAAVAFFTETVRQLLMHLAARDLPAAGASIGAREARTRTREVAAAGDRLLERAQAVLQSQGVGAWNQAVDVLFGPPAGERPSA